MDDHDEIGAVIARAKDNGFSGFGGGCFKAAAAINAALFGGRGTVVGAFNETLMKADGRLVGHMAVLVDGAYWDADGEPKEWEDVESWGMLDPEDPDYAEFAGEHGLAWDDEAASAVARVEYSQAELLSMGLGDGDLDGMIAALEQAKAEIAVAAPGPR